MKLKDTNLLPKVTKDAVYDGKGGFAIKATPIEILGARYEVIEELGNIEIKLDVEKVTNIINSRLDCPNCDNTGTTSRQVGDGYWQPEQCEFCYREENSKFNLAQAIASAFDSGKLIKGIVLGIIK